MHAITCLALSVQMLEFFWRVHLGAVYSEILKIIDRTKIVIKCSDILVEYCDIEVYQHCPELVLSLFCVFPLFLSSPIFLCSLTFSFPLFSLPLFLALFPLFTHWRKTLSLRFLPTLFHCSIFLLNSHAISP